MKIKGLAKAFCRQKTHYDKDESFYISVLKKSYWFAKKVKKSGFCKFFIKLKKGKIKTFKVFCKLNAQTEKKRLAGPDKNHAKTGNKAEKVGKIPARRSFWGRKEKIWWGFVKKNRV